MRDSNEIVNCVLAQFPLLVENFKAKEYFWLTLYLEGSPTSYAAVWPKLQECGWQNLGETDGLNGFAYPKKRILNSRKQVSEALSDVLVICEGTDVEIGMIDADTALNPVGSKFHNLYKS